MTDHTKPHIAFIGCEWFCRNGMFGGLGSTPKDAYRHFLESAGYVLYASRLPRQVALPLRSK